MFYPKEVKIVLLTAWSIRLIVKAEVDDYQSDVSVIKDGFMDFVSASENVSKWCGWYRRQTGANRIDK